MQTALDSTPLPTYINVPGLDHEADYEALRKIWAQVIFTNSLNLYTTSVHGDRLWAAFLDNLPVQLRQHYNCRCCKHFLTRYATLVWIGTKGERQSLLLDLAPNEVPATFRASLAAMRAIVHHSSTMITGLFTWADNNWGAANSGGWTHFYGKTSSLHKCYQRYGDHAARLRSEVWHRHNTLRYGINSYTVAAFQRAVELLQSGELWRKEVAVGMAIWLNDVKGSVHFAPTQHKAEGILWAAAASAPIGYSNVKSSVLGSLLDDIASGMSLQTIKNRWNERVDPTRYRRPKAAPKAQTIARANKRVEDDPTLRRALKRRFATLDDVQKFEWKPRPAATQNKLQPETGMFSYLSTPQPPAPTTHLSGVHMTLARFMREVLPQARSMELYTPHSGDYYGLMAAANKTGKPILQWDNAQHRNTVSWYLYRGGSSANQWGLKSHAWVPVTAVFRAPYEWADPYNFQHMPRRVFFALEGAAEPQCGSSCIFPESLKPDMHDIRSVIEAYSNSTPVPNTGKRANANGYVFCSATTNFRAVRVRVHTDTTVREITLDRWD